MRVGKTIRHAQIEPSHLPSLIGNSCKALRPHEGLVSAYLNCYLRHPAIGEWFEQHVRRGIVAILNDSILGELPVVLPPLEVQHEIGEIASSFDQKIQVHERIATTTRALRDRLVPELLVGSTAAGPRSRKKSR
jgi:restriction endonuclease S subunit